MSLIHLLIACHVERACTLIGVEGFVNLYDTLEPLDVKLMTVCSVGPLSILPWLYFQ
jgi:hypothetical protein